MLSLYYRNKVPQVKLDLSLSEGLIWFEGQGQTKCGWKHSERNKRLSLNFIVENLIICFTLYGKWLALTEVVIQLLKINQKIRSLLHTEEIIDVTLDISRAYQLTDYSLQ